MGIFSSFSILSTLLLNTLKCTNEIKCKIAIESSNCEIDFSENKFNKSSVLVKTKLAMMHSNLNIECLNVRGFAERIRKGK